MRFVITDHGLLTRKTNIVTKIINFSFHLYGVWISWQLLQLAMNEATCDRVLTCDTWLEWWKLLLKTKFELPNVLSGNEAETFLELPGGGWRDVEWLMPSDDTRSLLNSLRVDCNSIELTSRLVTPSARCVLAFLFKHLLLLIFLTTQAVFFQALRDHLIVIMY